MAKTICNYSCELGEGPTYDPAKDVLWWFNIVANQLHELEMDTGAHHIHLLPKMGSALGIIDETSQLVAMEDGLYLRDLTQNSFDLVQALEADNPVTRSNDGRIHSSGALWIGTMGKAAEKEVGSIYWYFKGELKKLYDKISIPNSICFSPNNDYAFFCDTMEEIIYKVAINEKNGLPIGEPEIFVNRKGGKGGIDGSIIDANGNLWNARWGSSKVDCYDLNGKEIASYDVPATQPSCPAFVGKGLNQIAVTTAWQHMSETQKENDPNAGHLFLLDVEVEGQEEPKVIL